MRQIVRRRAAIRHGLGGTFYACALLAGWAAVSHAGQSRTVAEGVYSADQSQRGQLVYRAQCLECHGETLGGVVGPPLAGDLFLAVWAGRSLQDLAEKIQKTMPVPAPGSLSPEQTLDLAAYILQAGGFPAAPTALVAAVLPRITFPSSRTAPAAPRTGGISFVPSGNLAQIMRAITFPNANIIFNVQIRDPGKPPLDAPAAATFDYVQWGSTLYPGWQAVDQAALALAESTPLFLLPGRRCENGRPVPVDRADWKQLTQALVDVSRDVYKASQTRNVEAVVNLAERLNDACANCHKVYRDGPAEGVTAGASRCEAPGTHGRPQL